MTSPASVLGIRLNRSERGIASWKKDSTTETTTIELGYRGVVQKEVWDLVGGSPPHIPTFHVALRAIILG